MVNKYALLASLLRLSEEPTEYFNEIEINECLLENTNLFMDLLENFYIEWCTNSDLVLMPIKQLFSTEGIKGDFRVMPCVINEFNGHIIKAVKIIGTNEEEKVIKDKISVGKSLLLHPTDNFPIAIFDVCALSSFRTAAISILAYKYFIELTKSNISSNKEKVKIGIIGAGRIAFYTAIILHQWLGINEVEVFEINKKHTSSFLSSTSLCCDKLKVTCKSIDQLNSNHNAVFLCTNSGTPILSSLNAKNIAFISSVGADADNLSELHSSILEGREIYTDSNGDTAIIITNNDNTMTVQVTMNGNTQVYTENNTGSTGSSSSTYNGTTATNTSSSKVFYGPNGASAQIFNNGGVNALKITYTNGKTNIYAQNTNTGNSGSVQSYTDSNGNTATLVTVNGKPQYEVTNIDGTKIIYSFGGGAYTPSTSNSSAYNSYSGTTYNGANGGSAGSYYGSGGGSAGYVQGPGGNSAGYVTGPNGNTVVGTSSSGSSAGYGTGYGTGSSDNSQYYIDMGVSSSDIPQGEEDKYILKSQVVPPICPVCAPVVKCDNNNNKKCPPCKPCGRCDEPSVTCQAVPNYNSENINRFLPQAVLNDFSTFGS